MVPPAPPFLQPPHIQLLNLTEVLPQCPHLFNTDNLPTTHKPNHCTIHLLQSYFGSSHPLTPSSTIIPKRQHEFLSGPSPTKAPQRQSTNYPTHQVQHIAQPNYHRLTFPQIPPLPISRKDARPRIRLGSCSCFVFPFGFILQGRVEWIGMDVLVLVVIDLGLGL